MELSEQGFPAEVIQLAALVRADLANALKNNAGAKRQGEAPELLRREKDRPGILVIRLFTDSDKQPCARVVEGEEAEVLIKEITDQEMIDKVIANAGNIELGRRWSIGAVSLTKKVGHFLGSSAKRSDVTTSFAGFVTQRFNLRNAPQIQQMVEGMIFDIMTHPATVIIRQRTMDVINVHGQGVKLQLKEGEAEPRRLFVGFIDSKFYRKPGRLRIRNVS